MTLTTKLFAALDEAGVVRFVSEVERGAACACFCPVCASPLVAKQGSLKEWHFAHEGSQERVECEVGALNMLRRVAAEMLQRGATPELPPYTQRVFGKSQYRVVNETVSWAAQMVPESLIWETCGLQSRPFVSGMLSTGAPFDAYVLVNDQQPTFLPPTNQSTAHLYFWVRTPIQADLQKRLYLEQHLRNTGRWVWKSHPEYQGMVSAAQVVAQQKAQEYDNSAIGKLRGLREEFARRQANAIQDQRLAVADQVARLAALKADQERSSVPWAPEHRPHSSFLFYQLKDGQGVWVIYTRIDGSCRMVPLPAFEGWEEAMPPSLGQPLLSEDAYLLKDATTAMLYLSARAEMVRTTSSPSEIERLAGIEA